MRGLRTLNTNTTPTGITRLCPAWGTVPRPAGAERESCDMWLQTKLWIIVRRLTKWCESISFRSRVSSSQDIGNCLLSDIKPENLRDVGDVVKVSSTQFSSLIILIILCRILLGTFTRSASTRTALTGGTARVQWVPWDPQVIPLMP